MQLRRGLRPRASPRLPRSCRYKNTGRAGHRSRRGSRQTRRRWPSQRASRGCDSGGRKIRASLVPPRRYNRVRQRRQFHLRNAGSRRTDCDSPGARGRSRTPRAIQFRPNSVVSRTLRERRKPETTNSEMTFAARDRRCSLRFRDHTLGQSRRKICLHAGWAASPLPDAMRFGACGFPVPAPHLEPTRTAPAHGKPSAGVGRPAPRSRRGWRRTDQKIHPRPILPVPSW